jgi:hypothetical protein
MLDSSEKEVTCTGVGHVPGTLRSAVGTSPGIRCSGIVPEHEFPTFSQVTLAGNLSFLKIRKINVLAQPESRVSRRRPK